MASVIAIAETGVNFGHTIEVHEIRIERNLRARRGLGVDESGLVVDKPEYNYYDPKVGDWKSVEVDQSKLNENGHVRWCGCFLCRSDPQ